MLARKLSVDQVNYLNIILMFVAAAAAFWRPFETFLIVYALLGPLHYLTEISWLHDRNYFTGKKSDAAILVVIGALITIGSLRLVPDMPQHLGTALTVFAFGAALIFVLVKNGYGRAVLLFLLLPLSMLAARLNWVSSVFSVLLPTIIHVFIFTGMFILVGALRGRSFSGIASLVVFVLISLSFFYLYPGSNVYTVSEQVRNNYRDFQLLNYYLMTPFSKHDFDQPANISEYIHFVNNVLYSSHSAFAVMAFIAFSYFYHYLNWFSKTSVIQWHQIPKSRFIGIIVIWLASIGIYAYDYALGLKWLFFLSFTHVLLEFPLNHLTFINIGKEIGAIVRGRPAVPVKVRGGSQPSYLTRGQKS
ncbi:MAG: hypothetical protein NZL95_02205 [Chitinophagales bacterium]|nr:hypothetical protein [Chitinophagales bacterium]MDW8427347.1 hypothetical protein [Chitinophagales bacterium]